MDCELIEEIAFELNQKSPFEWYPAKRDHLGILSTVHPDGQTLEILLTVEDHAFLKAKGVIDIPGEPGDLSGEPFVHFPLGLSSEQYADLIHKALMPPYLANYEPRYRNYLSLEKKRSFAGRFLKNIQEVLKIPEKNCAENAIKMDYENGPTITFSVHSGEVDFEGYGLSGVLALRIARTIREYQDQMEALDEMVRLDQEMGFYDKA